jgi:hypothetical protein
MSHRSTIRVIDRPGETLNDLDLARLTARLREVGTACFGQLPEYQCFTGRRADLADKVIAIAEDPDGRMTGFCSAIILDVPGVPATLHLGLTCVDPNARGRSLTHQLTSRLLVRHLMRTRPLGRIWVSNVACVLSSIGNVALSFDGVFPSPLGLSAPSHTHLQIADAISTRYREAIAIRPEADLDRLAFVFRRSVQGTVFQKRADDMRYHHRDPRLNEFYKQFMDFDRGDEVLQVGWYSLATLTRYLVRRPARVQVTAKQAA